ncbi:hypothetical protein A2627_00105 [Candidatus Woesebacteria bacterium RIFCSPHIGHO2_01_FULL_39_28]|uniref:AAA+ ATPase domain-containing protein n=1 Tax=Candidatus Woesebacteria bacterium RIFCSPHIGHO2_01_FULL_39_28 TaxID=1802496 RepID=A0A1F7YEY4_9BACT|nr:MAG: hypothetical protein A2627_00105 [Candidatus Woesebacteria bacterium RIFCSPHIGHO2_01_FULL_39_28]OGM57874.1 MAG: hypothetical protein A3A50_04535 [Candidatus Woesebacteria bacterium RIFCSPLOWO2_01_FULL_38_20]
MSAQIISTQQPEASSVVDVLVNQKVLTSKQAEEIKLIEVQTGKSQEEVINEKKLVSEANLVKAKASFYNIEYVDLASIPVSPEAMSELSKEVAEKFKVFPIAVDKTAQQVSLAMADPLDLTSIEFVEQKTGFSVKPYAAEPSKIVDFIQTKYATSLSKEVSAALKESYSEKDRVKTLDLTQGTGLIREEKIVQVVTQILDYAIKSRASDVHIEPMEESTRVRYRVDGILQEKLTVPRELHDSLVSRIKILSGMRIDEKRIPQDGRFNFKTEDNEVDLRVSSLPTTWGEKVVMRLLKKTGGIPTLQELGLRGHALKNLEDAILRPHGIILICGPTGSGKTTTLYSIISKINTIKVNIVTLEDPIEYKISGVNQVQINPDVGLTFASGLRSFLRQDPNVVLVGEVRDRETADLAVQASLTGHLVFSTLHTNDAPGAIPRLLDMGAEPYLLASSLTCIVAQRVLRKIDKNVVEAYDPDPKIIEDIKNVLGPLWKPPAGAIKLYRGKPTADNNNSGYLGRVGIYEVILVTEKVSRLILERAPASDIEKLARTEGMITLKQDGYLKVIEGITTIEEVLRVAQE